jgi:hypothetical protein
VTSRALVKVAQRFNAGLTRIEEIESRPGRKEHPGQVNDDCNGGLAVFYRPFRDLQKYSGL